MKIDLSKYINQEVEVTFSSGETLVGKVTYIPVPPDSSSLLEYRIGSEQHHIFTVDGFYYTRCSPNPNNIIKITSMKKYQKLEQQVKDLQKEIERLKEEENKVPKDFQLDHALSFLDCPNSFDLDDMFTWGISSQGEDYWEALHSELDENPDYKVPDKAIIQIQKWVIQYYRNKN